MSGVGERLEIIRDRARQACHRAGRKPDEVSILAVSKTFPADLIREAFEAGQRMFGESRLQEAEGKIGALGEEIDWHFIGQLQRNKARKVVTRFSTIHSLDSLRLAEHLDRVAGEEGVRPGVYLELNLAGEATKGGFDREDLRLAFPLILAMRHLRPLGLMVIPPPSDDPGETRRWFAESRAFQDELETENGVTLPALSMGMSEDFEIAIEEGSTVIRVGSAIFGDRTTTAG